MGTMVKGEWRVEDKLTRGGRFERERSSIRGVVGSLEHPVEAGRYILYIMEGCPWAHRTYLAWKMLGLEDVIELAMVQPMLTEQGWVFGEAGGRYADPLGRAALHEVYSEGHEGYTGRCTVPVLWDRVTATIVNNESADILRMLSHQFSGLARAARDLRPASRAAELDELNDRIYRGLNNGVYRAGFAQTQHAHDEAVTEVFETLDWLDALLSDGREFLLGDALTEADIRLLTTLLRFEAYRVAFLCDLQPPSAHPHVWAYRERARSWPGVAQTSLAPEEHTRGYCSIPFAAVNNPAIERRNAEVSHAA